jgi:predicted transcriptional regulator
LSGIVEGVLKNVKPHPEVSPKKLISPDFIICLEDGKKLKMLKRHLKTSYNLSPYEY